MSKHLFIRTPGMSRREAFHCEDRIAGYIFCSGEELSGNEFLDKTQKEIGFSIRYISCQECLNKFGPAKTRKRLMHLRNCIARNEKMISACKDRIKKYQSEIDLGEQEK